MSVNTKINGQLVKSAGLYNSIIPLGIADIYSTEERQVGCFVDGKPLYQKSFYIGDGVNNSTIQVAHNIANIESVANAYGCFTNKNNGQPISFPNGSEYVRLNVEYDKIYVKCVGTWAGYKDLYVTIQYTKTTDTAGSGIWTPSGAQAEHYSEAEHIVGTWIDGSTLYEKTFVQQLSGNTAHIDISAYDMKKAFIHDGFYDIGVTMQSLCEWIGSSANSWTHINTGSQYLYIDCYNSVASNSTIYVTVRYTKNS